MPILLYKAAVQNLLGDDLLPLNLIRHRYPALYDRERLKYARRPHVMDHPVHPLGCRWADVLFFSPVHPTLIFDALREAGRVSGQPDYWTIDAELLSPERTCILLKRHDPLFQPQPADDYLPFTPEAAAALAVPSAQALERLRTLTPTEPILPWADIPHVLHRGPIPVTSLRTSDGGVIRSRRDRQ
ncbi:hypothetical protein BWI15_11280 [Kribbella sp. ALI-6-A]|uniref:hypothetical protein n=1 Tax=Kribbella sp. ALI-6-A TaxID=1933817 RepID=UPI00097C09FF|nr:hypothetical protein [Kribbella sp. ALI-6-A]ONI73967.1 hypothetical protein BWI15_11280 [Kribbella sp. ALI-6-A]